MATLFLAGYPLITENTTGTSVIASGTINQSGQLFSVIVPQASGEPSAQQVYDGQDSASGSLAANFVSSAIEVSSSGTVVALSGYGLSSETDYTMYVVASGYDDGLMATASGLEFTTPDITAPAWTAGYPAISAISTDSALASLNLNDDGSGYFVVVPRGSSAPNATQIKAGQNADSAAVAAGLYGSTALTASSTTILTISNLNYSTAYTLYVVGEDDAGNATSPDVYSVNFTTNVPPSISPNSLEKKLMEQRKRINRANNMMRSAMMR